MENQDSTTLYRLSPFYGLIRVFGQNAKTFLQGQLSCDMEKITPTQPGFGAYCTQKGRIRALFQIFLYEDTYLLQLPLSLLTNTLKPLEKVARFSKVTLEDFSNKIERFGMITKIPSNLLNQDPELFFAELPGKPQRFELLSPYNRFEKTTQITDLNDWTLAQIQAGIPEIYPETSEKFLPHSLNLPALNAVSFDKGCYCGQEIIARMQYRANLKRHLYHAIFENDVPISPGITLYTPEEKEAGSILISAMQEDSIEALVELQDVFQNNTLFYVHTPEKQYPLQLRSLKRT